MVHQLLVADVMRERLVFARPHHLEDTLDLDRFGLDLTVEDLLCKLLVFLGR